MTTPRTTALSTPPDTSPGTAAATLMRAGLPTTASLARYDPAAPGTADLLPAGLTDADARRIASAVTAAHSPNTRTAYAQMW